ncbi:transposase [Solwaraspora sp. WMMD791]|uniref:transposase n=1 Tax=Solwaraspora sp. WMMD791 TaxID=3016086 RepID=UPI00249B508B|nr:transposase [Solwaraspora sp. WMMD791]WFE27297.1 transposase [Solwaraspora sp. WMMD791]
MCDLFGVPMSVGAVAAAHTHAGDALADSEFVDQVRDALTSAPVVHADKSGPRVAGKPHWVQVATTGKYTLVWVHAKRGRAGIDPSLLAKQPGLFRRPPWSRSRTTKRNRPRPGNA